MKGGGEDMEYDLEILRAKQLIENADYILIGAGAGISTAAGLEYSGENFERNFKEYIEKYHFEDLYSASFYDFNTQEEKWAFWAKMIKLNRFNEEPLKLYQELLSLVKNKNYFVITTNVDGQFENAGFDTKKIFAVQGDYALLQCENACRNKTYNNKELVKQWLENTENLKIPIKLVPKCPVCGGNMEMNLRKDANFVQDENWYKQADKYDKFLDDAKNKNLVLLELGVGFNTPGIIRIPFEQMVFQNKNWNLVRVNKNNSFTYLDLEENVILIEEDIEKVVEVWKKNK
mgnify:CR=1 FL=1